MLMLILTNTPKWVFVLFAVLVWLGIKQMFDRTMGLNRAIIMPIAMTVLSLLGVTTAFGDSSQALLAWAGAAALVCTISLQVLRTDRVQYDSRKRAFQMPGSVVPLMLFMGIFFTKYVVGASMGMNPALAQNANFALFVSALYGSFTGIFLARAIVLVRIALRQSNAMSVGSVA